MAGLLHVDTAVRDLTGWGTSVNPIIAVLNVTVHPVYQLCIIRYIPYIDRTLYCSQVAPGHVRY